MKFFARLLIIVLAVAGATAFTQLQTQRLYQKQDAKALSVADDIQTARARIGGVALDIEIADTDAERAQGLSFREALAESEIERRGFIPCQSDNSYPRKPMRSSYIN